MQMAISAIRKSEAFLTMGMSWNLPGTSTRTSTPSLALRMSESQMAVLGLCAARRMGIDVARDVWERHAAALCKMADRGQITGGLLDGPLAFDNAIDKEAARIKGIKSEVAGRAQILLVPDLESGNMLAKNLTYFAKADGAGIVLGARVPVVLTSRADTPRSRMASCAVATLYANARRTRAQTAAA